MTTKKEWLETFRIKAMIHQEKWAQFQYEDFQKKLSTDPWCVEHHMSDYPYGFRLAGITSPAAPTKKAAELFVEKLTKDGFSAFIETIPQTALLAVTIKDPLSNELNSNTTTTRFLSRLAALKSGNPMGWERWLLV